MDDFALVKIMETFQNFYDVACDKTFIEFTERFQGLSKGAVLCVSIDIKSISIDGTWQSDKKDDSKKGDSLENDTQSIFISSHPFILDDTGMR